MVERNSSFPEGIRFQDCKASLGISFGLSHELWGNYWVVSGELNIAWIQGNSAVTEKAFGISNEAHNLGGGGVCASLSKAIRTNSGL